MTHNKLREMGFDVLRNIVRPLARSILTHNNSSIVSSSSSAAKVPHHSLTSPTFEFRSSILGIFQQQRTCLSNELHSLTDTRFPKRRPGFKPRRKRASLKPPGPYAWVQYTPGEPILANRPNEGSVKRRNEKKRIKLKKAFILSEKKKRKAQMQEAKKKKNMMRIERKMATVARDRAWAQRLAELQKLEAEKATQA